MELNLEADEGIVDSANVTFDSVTDVLIAGGGGTGLPAALAASERSELEITVLEKAPEFGGNMALSAGMIPATGTRMQQAAEVDDSPETMAADILEKNDYEADTELVTRLCEESAHLIHWLVDDWGVELSLVDDFLYPGHSRYRMHSTPERSGQSLVDALVARLDDRPNVALHSATPVRKLVRDEDAVVGAITEEGEQKPIKARKVILATDGFGANSRMIETHCGEIRSAHYHGVEGNTGEGIRWGAALGAALANMNAYLAHATQTERGPLSTYAVIMRGGILVNQHGERFGDETVGYSRFANEVLKQPDGVAYQLFDESIYQELRGSFGKFDEAVAADAYHSAVNLEALTRELGCDPDRARASVEAYNTAVRAETPDQTGRETNRSALTPPFYGAKVHPALHFTQGGLVVDRHARVCRADGDIVENLYAGGGTACGVSGSGSGGYLTGNGLLTALVFGHIAGRHSREAIIT